MQSFKQLFLRAALRKCSTTLSRWLFLALGMAFLSLVLFSVSVFLSLKVYLFHLFCIGGKAFDLLLLGTERIAFRLGPN